MCTQAKSRDREVVEMDTYSSDEVVEMVALPRSHTDSFQARPGFNPTHMMS